MRSRMLATLSMLAVVSTAGPGWAAGTVTLTPAGGHPNLPVTVAGTGFGDSEAVDVYVDTADTLLLVASATGTLSGAVTIPASAQPGIHYVTAIGRHSGTAAQKSFNVSTPWFEQGFGAAHLGWNPYENTLNTSNVSGLGTQWQISVNGYGGAPAVVAGRVFIDTGNGMLAVSSTTGATLWTSLTSSGFYASPAVSGTSLYVGDGGAGNMYSLNTATGAKIWTTATGGSFESSPVVAGGLVYAGCVDDKVYAFSAATGAIVWTYTTGGFIDSSPAVVNGVVYIGSTDQYVYALNAKTGALIWSYKTGSSVESSPAVSNGVVYIGSDDSKMYALNAVGANTGSLLWSYTAGGAVLGGPAVANGVVYFGSTDGNLYAASARTGALQYSVATGGIVETPVVADGVVYVTSRSGSLLAINATSGSVLASAVTGYSFLGNPTVADGVLYLNAYGYNTYAFSLLAGTSAVPAQRAPVISSLQPDRSLVPTRGLMRANRY